MNPSTLARIHTFTHKVLRLAFADIEQRLKTQSQYFVMIVSDANTGLDEVDTLLQEMHPEQPYFAQLFKNNPSLQDLLASVPLRWIGESLYIETLQNIEIEPSSFRQYCLSIAFTIAPTEEIQLTAIVGYTEPNNIKLQIQTLPFKSSLNPLNIFNIEGIQATFC